MKKQFWIRAIWGFPMGIAIGTLLSLLFSFLQGKGDYVPCVPSLVTSMGGELRAVLFQTILSGLVGSSFSATSVIWNVEDWSLLQQTLRYFLINGLVLHAAAYLAHWMQPDWGGFFGYFLVYLLLFLVIWVLSYFCTRRNVQQMNAKLQQVERVQSPQRTTNSGPGPDTGEKEEK